MKKFGKLQQLNQDSILKNKPKKSQKTRISKINRRTLMIIVANAMDQYTWYDNLIIIYEH